MTYFNKEKWLETTTPSNNKNSRNKKPTMPSPTRLVALERLITIGGAVAKWYSTHAYPTMALGLAAAVSTETASANTLSSTMGTEPLAGSEYWVPATQRDSEGGQSEPGEQQGEGKWHKNQHGEK